MITGNEPAMPIQIPVFGKVIDNHRGLTIREHFAAMAMQGILSNPEFLAHHKDIDIHSIAVENADALIAELNKQP